MARGMFRTGGDNTSTTGGVTVTVEPGVGLPGRVDYGQIPSDLIRDELAETQFIRDFFTKFKDKLGDKDASKWIRVLGEYAVGNATEEDLKAVDVSDLAEMPGWSEYYSSVIGEEADTSEVETTEEDTGVSDQDAISAVMATVPDKLKGLITEDNIIKVLEEVAKMNDPMTQIKRDMGAGIEIKWPGDWRNWKVFGPLAIPGVPLPPGIIDVTLGEIEAAVKNAGKDIKGVIGSVGDFVNDMIKDPTGTLEEIGKTILGKVNDVVSGVADDPWGGTFGGFEDWVKGILGNVVGGSVLTGIYDTAKDLIETGTTAVVGGTDTDGEEEDKGDIFKQLLGTVEDTLEVDPDLFVGSVDTEDTTTDIVGGDDVTKTITNLLGGTISQLDDGTPPEVDIGGLVPEPPKEPPDLPPEPPVDPETPEPPVKPGGLPPPTPPVTPPELPPEPPVKPGGGGGNGSGGGNGGGGTTIDVGGLNYPPETPIEIGGTEVSTGGSGAVGGGDGMFTGNIRRTSYMPQALPGVKLPPRVDAMASIEGLIGRMLTGRIS